MHLQLVNVDGSTVDLYWIHQQQMEIARDVLHIGSADTGMAWLMYNPRLFVWEELTIDGDPTGRQFVSFKFLKIS